MASKTVDLTRIAAMEGFKARPARPEDIDAIHNLYIAADQNDQKDWAGERQQTAADFSDPEISLERDSLVIVDQQGELAATGWIYLNEEAVRERRAFLFGCVHPRYRRQKLGTRLMVWLVECGSARLAEFRDEELPHILQAASMEHTVDRIRLFEQFGFQPARYYFRMRRELSEPVPTRPDPAGIRIETMDRKWSEAVRVCLNTAFHDHYGSEPVSATAWEQHFIGADSFRPQQSFVALDGDRLIGASYNRERMEENTRHGIQEGWISKLGVLREYRGRGIASTLLLRSLKAFQEQGMQYAGLSVDTQNQTGALGLYERLGFQPIVRSVSYRKEIG